MLRHNFLSWISLLMAALPAMATNMNGRYKIANGSPHTSNEFNTDYVAYHKGNVAYFDVYSPVITTRYGDVFWTLMDEVPLPPEIVQKFDNRVMAIVGYEADQVIRERSGDKSVPITWAYNHHYLAYVKGKMGEVRKVRPSDNVRNFHQAQEHWHAFRREDDVDPQPDAGIPVVQLFSEGNGGEFRKSFHGYPSGMAQLVESPRAFQIEVMQIDTKNRDYNGTDFRPGPLPKISPAPPDAAYSGLLECPCSTRIERTVSRSFYPVAVGSCSKPVTDSDECLEAAKALGLKVKSMTNIFSAEVSSGCLAQMNKLHSGAQLMFNHNLNSTVQCGHGRFVMAVMVADEAKVKVKVTIDTEASTVKIIMSGPDSSWFGIGFNSPNYAMADLPYTIVVEGDGSVSEWKIANHHHGHRLESSLKDSLKSYRELVTANAVYNGQRIVSVTRALKGVSPDHHTFDPEAGRLPCIVASGTTTYYGYHGTFRTGGDLSFIGVDKPTCICRGEVTGSINGVPFHKDCMDRPHGDLVAEDNPACNVDTYQGGLSCCHHKVVLLDKDQPQPRSEFSYQLKFRFWYQDFEMNAAANNAPSHTNLIRLYWQTEAYATEYDIRQCTKDDDICEHTIQAQFTLRDMFTYNKFDCDVRSSPTCWGNVTNFDGAFLIYISGHCHAPSCISMELFNDETGELLCRQVPIHGGGRGKFDEVDYLAIPPCLFGEAEDGLQPPTFLHYDTRLRAVKKNNNTYAHFGEMASWQMRGYLSYSNSL